MVKEIWLLLLKEWKEEWNKRYAMNGILLYTGSVSFICYLSFQLRSGALQPVTWNVLFWIIVLFSILNAAHKSFIGQTDGHQLYLHTLVSAESIILSKMIYNGLLSIIIALVTFLSYALVMGSDVKNMSLYFFGVILGSLSMGSALTLVSSIAARAQNAHVLMSILGFPILLPILLLVIKISKFGLDGLAWEFGSPYIWMLLAVTMIINTTAVVLFPYIWKS